MNILYLIYVINIKNAIWRMIKNFYQFVNEKKESYGNNILEFLKKYVSITDGYQKRYYEIMLDDAKIIKCSSMHDVFSEDEIKTIKRFANPKVKQCYRNSYLLQSQCDIPDILYCEGYTSYMGLPIEHAFNKVGDKYIDITSEIVLKKDVADDEYVLLGEYDEKKVREIITKNGYYGGVYNKLLLDRIKKG